MAAGGSTLRSAVTTGDDNPVETAPFSVRVECPPRWDPSEERLPTTYSIIDTNERIQRGRLRFLTFTTDEGATDGTALHTVELNRSQLQHGVGQELPEDSCWDGVITSGIRERDGERVTADLARIAATLEVWNADEREPPPLVEGGRGRTEQEGVWVAMDSSYVEIDAINEATWDRSWVVPRVPEGYPDYDAGKSTLTIEVKNIREGESVRVEVRRIMDEEDAMSGQFYASSDPGFSESQPHLQGLVVRDGRVVKESDDSQPAVIFNEFHEHWRYPGINFYAFFVGFGERGDLMVASERRAPEEGEEDRRLCMRYAVFIHAPAGNLPSTRQASRQVDRFLNQETTYWRSTLLVGGADGINHWLRHFIRKYAVLFEGHASCSCLNAGTTSAASGEDEEEGPTGHPTYTAGSEERFKRLPRRGFRPDQNRCPPDSSCATATVGGCGVKDWVRHELVLERCRNHPDAGDFRNKKLVFGTLEGQPNRQHMNMWVEDGITEAEAAVVRAEGREPRRSRNQMMLDYAPRFLMFSDACRTMLTTNLAEVFAECETQHHHGWIYASTDAEAQFVVDVMRRWIRGTDENPAPNECDPGRFVSVYLAEARRTRGRRRYYPRLMEGTRVLNPAEAPSPGTGPGEALA